MIFMIAGDVVMVMRICASFSRRQDPGSLFLWKIISTSQNLPFGILEQEGRVFSWNLSFPDCDCDKAHWDLASEVWRCNIPPSNLALVDRDHCLCSKVAGHLISFYAACNGLIMVRSNINDPVRNNQWLFLNYRISIPSCLLISSCLREQATWKRKSDATISSWSKKKMLISILDRGSKSKSCTSKSKLFLWIR